MDANALARSLQDSKGADGTVSLRELAERLHRTGQDELARAVDSLAGRLSHAAADMDAPVVPWF